VAEISVVKPGIGVKSWQRKYPVVINEDEYERQAEYQRELTNCGL
jgi:hypothetical protein